MVHCNDESLLEVYFKRFSVTYPDIYLKARSGMIEETPQLTLVLSGRGENKERIDVLLNKAHQDLTVWLSEEGGFSVKAD